MQILCKLLIFCFKSPHVLEEWWINVPDLLCLKEEFDIREVLKKGVCSGLGLSQL